MLKVNLDGVVFEGSPAAIILAIKDGGIDFSQTDTLDEYMEWLAKNAFRMCGVGIALPDGSTDEKAASLVQQLIGAGMVQEVVECPRCKNADLGPGARYCKICGLEIDGSK